MARHQRGGCLAQRAGFHVMGEIDDAPVAYGQIDNYGRAAEARMRFRARLGALEPSKPRNIRGQFEHASGVDLVEHLRFAAD